MTKNYKLYEVGGCVRDELLGLESKDIDYVWVFDDPKYFTDAQEAFVEMANVLNKEGFETFLATPDCFTIRAKFPKDHKHYPLVADFVMARKEIGYDENSRKPQVVVGTLYDDLERRDFTVNALAKGEDGIIIDYFDGLNDLEWETLRTPIDPQVSFSDDPLRILRAIRFAVTKDFKVSDNTYNEMLRSTHLDKLRKVVSEERIREELYKCFKYNTVRTLNILVDLKWHEWLFENNMWLKPTTKEK